MAGGELGLVSQELAASLQHLNGLFFPFLFVSLEFLCEHSPSRGYSHTTLVKHWPCSGYCSLGCNTEMHLGVRQLSCGLRV